MLSKIKLKYIQTLSQKKQRELHGVFLAEGARMVEELLYTMPRQIVEIFAEEKWCILHAELLQKQGHILHKLATHELEKISQLHTPNQVVAVVKQFETKPVSFERGKWILALDTIQDPGNLGTIIRVADWFGINDIVCSHETADCYNSKVIQATMSSIFRVQIQYVNLPKWLGRQKEATIYGAVLDGESIKNISTSDGGILVIGNESKGISPEVMKCTTKQITIPRIGKAESLNAAVATGIILSQIVN